MSPITPPTFMVPYNICEQRAERLLATPVPPALDKNKLHGADKLFGAVSRSMSVGTKMMDDPLYEVVMVAYLVCKLADGAEDVVPDGNRPDVTQHRSWRLLLIRAVRDYISNTHNRRPANLQAVEAWIPVTQQDEAHRIALLNLEQICFYMMQLPQATREVVVFWVMHMLYGMEWGIDNQFRFGTQAELGYYTWAVAGTVGYMLTDLCALYSDPGEIDGHTMATLLVQAENLGALLQETNYVRNLAEDTARLGHPFVSRSMLQTHGIHDPHTFCDPAMKHQAMDVVAELCGNLYARADVAVTYVSALPTNPAGMSLRRFALFSLLMATRTAFVSEKNPEVLRDNTPDIKVSKQEMGTIMQWSRQHAGADKSTIGGLVHRMRKKAPLYPPLLR